MGGPGIGGVGAPPVGSGWSSNIAFDTVNGAVPGVLDIHGTFFNWLGASIGAGNVAGQVYVDNGSVLNLNDVNSSLTLGANLFVGIDLAGTRSNATVSFNVTM